MPVFQSCGKRFVHGILGEIKITEQANQSCQNPSRVRPIQQFDRSTYLLQSRFRHALESSKPAFLNQLSAKSG